jgi:hypothetical protein
MGHAARMEDMRNSYKTLVGKPEWKRPLGRTRRRWKDIIVMDIIRKEFKVVDWSHAVWDRN